MKTEELKNLIDLYFDRELAREKEVLLFTSLGADEEAREYFKKLNTLQNTLSGLQEEYPQTMDEKIFRSIQKKETGKVSLHSHNKVFTAIAYSFSIILLAVSIFFYSKSEEYKVQFFNLTREVKNQNEQIKLLMNALPQVNVQGSYVKIKEVVVTPQS